MPEKTKNNSDNYKISVVMSVYKNDLAENFKTSIDSILNQTYKPNEIVLVVDGPVSMETENLLKEYEKNNLFNIIKFDKNKGLGIALQKGCEQAKYPIIARMDSDDIAYPTRFEKQINYLKENPTCDAVAILFLLMFSAFFSAFSDFFSAFFSSLRSAFSSLRSAFSAFFSSLRSALSASFSSSSGSSGSGKRASIIACAMCFSCALRATSAQTVLI